jgi:hypothetical protein
MWLIAFLLALALPAGAAFAQGAAVRAAAKELAEVIVERGGRAAAEDLARFGGEEAVRGVLEKAAREGGESLAERAAQLGRSEGLDALRVIDRAPARWVGALEGLPKDALRPAILAARREPELMTKLVTTYGERAAEVAARHPGIGPRLVEKLGQDGIDLGMKLGPDEAMILTRHADEIAALAPAERSAVLARIGRAPKAVLGFLERNPRVLLTSAGLAAFLAAKDQLLGPAGEADTNPDGTVVKPAAGLLERMTDKVIDRFEQPMFTILFVVAFLIFAWGALQLWHVWRIKRMKQAAVERRG